MDRSHDEAPNKRVTMNNIEPPLKYYSHSVGNTELIVDNNNISLYENGQSWMGLDLNTKWQANEFVFELSEATGVCVTTGLGLGVIQTLLVQNANVTKVIVFEKNKSVIDIFLYNIEKNNFDISKLEIINVDADNIQDIVCDCMFLDHFEHEPEHEIIDRVKKISKNNTFNLLWYWPCIKHFSVFCSTNTLEISNKSFDIWKTVNGFEKLPKELNSLQLNNIMNLRNEYYSRSQNIFDFQIQNQKNKLLSLFGSKK